MKKPPPDERVSELDRQIAARLKEARHKLGLTQSEVAKQIDITRASLASYEEGRVALRLYVGQRITRQFIISEKWLATGQGHWRRYMDIRHEHEVLDLQLSPLMPYGEAFVQHLAPIYDEISSESVPARPARLVGRIEDAQHLKNVLDFMVSHRWETLPLRDATQMVREFMTFCDHLAGIFGATGAVPEISDETWDKIASLISPEYAKALGAVANIEAEARAFLESGKQGIPSDAIQAKESGSGSTPRPLARAVHDTWRRLIQLEKRIDSTDSVSLNRAAMAKRLNWDSLRKRLVAVTEREGAKAELSEALQVSLVSVSQWRHDSARPDADKALRLLAWIELQEEKYPPSAPSQSVKTAARPIRSKRSVRKARSK